MPEEKAPEGVDEKLWQANKDLQKQAREQIEKEQQAQRDAAAKAAADPTASTLPGMTVAEAGAENERLAKETGQPPLAAANEPDAGDSGTPAPKTPPKK
jgi:hypothetical protein